MSLDINNQILEAIKNNLTELVLSYFQNNEVDLSWEQDSFFTEAVITDNLTLIKYFLSQNIDPSFDNNFLFRIAAGYGLIDILKILIEDNRVNPADDQNNAIFEAYDAGNTKVVFYLFDIKKVKETLNNDQPDIYAYCITEQTSKKIAGFI